MLPAARTMQGGAALVPGVSFYSQGFVSTMSIHGSATADQHIFFDGMNIGQNLTRHRQPGERRDRQRTGADRAGLRRRIAVGREPARRRADGFDPEGRRQQLLRRVAHDRLDAARFRTTTSPSELQPFISVEHAARLQLRHERRLRRPDSSKNRLWFLFAQRVSRTNNLIAFPDGVLPNFPNGTQVESGGFIVPHETVRLTCAGDAAQQDRLGVLQVAGRHAAVRRRLRRHQRQRGRLHRAGSRVRAAAAAAVRQPGEVDLADHAAACCSKSGSRSPCRRSTSATSRRTDRSTSSTATRRRACERSASNTAPYHYFSQIWNTVANMSYVTGSHNMKFGIEPPGGLRDEPDRAARRHVAC